MIILEKCEVNITRHCNNHCVCCNHGSPWADPYFMDPETLRRDLAVLSPLLHVGFFCLQGGEPLLHPRLIELMDVAMNSGIADKYGILSNGRLLPQMPEAFFQKAGQMKLELRVSAYPNLDRATLAEPTRKAIQYGFEIRPGGIEAFQKLFREQPDGGVTIWRICPWKNCYTVHEGWFFHCPLAAFFPEQFFGLPRNTDGLPLAGLTEATLAEFLARTIPLKTCAHCNGASGTWIGWHQVYNRDQWIKESTE